MLKFMKRFISRIKGFLKQAWEAAFPVLIKYGEAAVAVTDIVKGVVDSPVTDLVVKLTPTQADDAVLAKAKLILPVVTYQLGLSLGIVKELNDGDSVEEVMAIILKHVGEQLPKEGKAIFYRELSGQVAYALADGNISKAEAVALTQLIFKKLL